MRHNDNCRHAHQAGCLPAQLAIDDPIQLQQGEGIGEGPCRFFERNTVLRNVRLRLAGIPFEECFVRQL